MADQNPGQQNPPQQPPPQGQNPPPSQGKSGDSKSTSPEDRQKAQKEVQDLRQKLQEAEAKLAQTGATRATTAEEDMKMMQDRSQGQQVRVVGKAGGPFTINGEGFGNSSGQQPWPGQVLVAGRSVPITSWRDHSIKGTLPPDLPQKGEVEVTINTGSTGKEQKLKGAWPPAPRAPQQITVRTPDGKLVQGEFVQNLQQPGHGNQQTGQPGYLPGAQGVQGGGPDMNPPPGSTGTLAGQQVGTGQAPGTATGGPVAGTPGTPNR